MSNKNRNKGNKTVTEETNAIDKQEQQPVTQTPEAGVEGSETTATEQQPVVAEQASQQPEPESPAAKADEAPTSTAPDPEPAPAAASVQLKEIKVGTVVDPNQGKLGSKASDETVARVTNASTAKPEDTSTAFEQKMQAINANGSAREKFVLSSIQSYIETVAPGKMVTADEGVRAQQSLYRTVLNIVNSDDEFDKAFKLLISLVREYRTGVFADTHAFRFFEYAKPGQEWPTTLRNMLTLLIVASGVNNKKEVHKLVMVSKAVQVGLSEAARQRVIQYFS